jgi:hypothetical protein
MNSKIKSRRKYLKIWDKEMKAMIEKKQHIKNDFTHEILKTT